MFDIELHYEELLGYAKKLAIKSSFLLPEDLINECYVNSDDDMDVASFKTAMLAYYKKEKRNTFDHKEYDDSGVNSGKVRLRRIKENGSFTYIQNIDDEEWRKIENVDGNYFISNKGRIKSKSISREKILRPFRHRIGYIYHSFTFKNLHTTKSIHRLVGFAFIPNPNNYAELDHLDEDKSNNAVSNLEWVDHQENMRRYFFRNKHKFKFEYKDPGFIKEYNNSYYSKHKNNDDYKKLRNKHSAKYYSKNGTKSMSKYISKHRESLSDQYIKILLRAARENRGKKIIITPKMIADKRKKVLASR